MDDIALNLEATVRQNVRKLREGYGWNRKHLARRMGIDDGTMTRLENGDRHISIRYLQMLAEGLAVNPSDLLGEVSEPLFVVCGECGGRGVVPREAERARQW